MGKMIKGLTLSAVASTVVVAGGYKIPEQSLNAMALSSAYVAHTSGADTNYYNPANMAFMDEGKSYVEGGITLAHLPSNVYSYGPLSGESEEENLPIPFLHYVGKPTGDFRWGVSIVAPAGLTKRWKTPFQKLSAEEFTLKVIELNPSMSYKIADNFSIGGGLRLIYSEGVVRSEGIHPFSGTYLKRDMEGDTVEFGYNLAMTYKPASDISFAVTYRSKIDLDEDGTAKLYSDAINPNPDYLFYNGGASVSVPLPATLSIGLSKTWNDKFTLEFNYERAYWSSYKTLDFEYDSPQFLFDEAIAKNWKDADRFGLGATIEMDNKITAMMAFVIDESPAPVETLGFELPDSDAKVFSMGFRYQQTENLSWGAALLYTGKDSISVVDNDLIPGGTFTEGGAFLTTIGVSYEY